MKSWQSNISLWLSASVVGIISTLVTQPAWAEAKLENRDKLSQKGIDNLHQQIEPSTLGDRLKQEVNEENKASVLPGGINDQKASLLLKKGWGEQQIRQLSDLETPITSAQQLLVQSPTEQTTPAPTIQITRVKANPTDKGVEVILETPKEEQLQLVNRSAGNSYIADIPNAQLRLPSGEAFVFRSQKPIAGISEITVTNFDANTIRVTVTGEAGVPIVELFDSPEEGLIFSIASAAASSQPQQQPQTPPTSQEQPGSETQPSEPSAEGDEQIELLVTGSPETGYNVPDASTATRTDTPIRDIPQSIQIVPQQVLEDRNVRTVNEAVETVSGVIDGGDTIFRIFRGFSTNATLAITKWLPNRRYLSACSRRTDCGD